MPELSTIINWILTILLIAGIGYVIFTGVIEDKQYETNCKPWLEERLQTVQYRQNGVLYDCKINISKIENEEERNTGMG